MFNDTCVVSHSQIALFFVELEIQDRIEVSTSSNEDVFAIKLLNLYTSVKSFLHGATVAREVPIFGVPFKNSIFISGVIDEIRVDYDTYTWDIIELKTRQTNSTPSKSQKLTHRIQVMLYKKLFDDLVCGTMCKDVLQQHLHLDFQVTLGNDVVAHLKELALQSFNLEALWNELRVLLTVVPRISNLFIEYCYQKTSSTIAVEPCSYDEQWLKEQMMNCSQYWQGIREAVGVDIEDAWKCQKCQFSDICEWRQRKAEELKRKNSLNVTQKDIIL